MEIYKKLFKESSIKDYINDRIFYKNKSATVSNISRNNIDIKYDDGTYETIPLKLWDRLINKGVIKILEKI